MGRGHTRMVTMGWIDEERALRKAAEEERRKASVACQKAVIAKRAALADVDRLTRERDEARATVTANVEAMSRLVEERDEARTDADEYSQTVDRLSELLRGVADALKGPPGPLELHDWSDLPEVAAEARAEAAAFASCNRARQAAEEDVERLRVADEWTTKALAALFYLRGIDGDQLDRMIEEYELDADLLEADRA